MLKELLVWVTAMGRHEKQLCHRNPHYEVLIAVGAVKPEATV